MTDSALMTIDEAIRTLRADPESAEIVRDSYLDRDVGASANRFHRSAEWAATLKLLQPWLPNAAVLDLGSGVGLAARGFAQAGASRVYAVEPDPSDEVGRGALMRLDPGPGVEVVDAWGESLPVPTGSIDIVYARQVLHHASDLDGMIAECARVLRPGGVMLAVREHVVDDENQLRLFLESHPVNRLAGGENAYSLDQYLTAFSRAGLRRLRILRPLDSVITAFPRARSEEELRGLPREALSRRLGGIGRVAAYVPGALPFVRWHQNRQRDPGRLYGFLYQKPK